MSAYIVDRHHIIFLVDAALSHQICRYGFCWWEGETRKDIRPSDFEVAADAANMLWRENIRSVSYRYPHESSATLPGPIGEDYNIGVRHVGRTHTFDPIQIIKACDCFEYQACEHPEWKTSEAHSFIDRLRRTACTALPGYDKAKWGAPEVRRAATL